MGIKASQPTQAEQSLLPTPGLLWVNAWPSKWIGKDEIRPELVAIPVAAMDHLQSLAQRMHPSMNHAVFKGEHGCPGARLLCRKSEMDVMYESLGEPMDWPEDTVWIAPTGVAYVPYYRVGSLDHDYNAPANVVVWHSGHFQLHWDAMDHAPDECLIESEFFSIGELAREQDH